MLRQLFFFVHIFTINEVIVKHLIKHGEDMNIETNADETALFRTCRNGNKKYKNA